MVVVRPAKPEPVLPGFLDLCSTIAALPINAFFFKHQGARKITADFFHYFIEDPVCLLESFCVTWEISASAIPEALGLNARSGVKFGFRNVTAIPAALDHI